MDGDKYYFTTQEQMLQDIAKNRFIEYGQFDGHYYGTRFDTIQQGIREGKMCILDISPQVNQLNNQISLVRDCTCGMGCVLQLFVTL